MTHQGNHQYRLWSTFYMGNVAGKMADVSIFAEHSKMGEGRIK
jgi:hypothetical protein